LIMYTSGQECVVYRPQWGVYQIKILVYKVDVHCTQLGETSIVLCFTQFSTLFQCTYIPKYKCVTVTTLFVTPSNIEVGTIDINHVFHLGTCIT